jgi:hypothetical protein
MVAAGTERERELRKRFFPSRGRRVMIQRRGFFYLREDPAQKRKTNKKEMMV